MPTSRRPAFPDPALVLVTDSTRRHGRAPQGRAWLDDVVREAVLGGVNVVQLREKHRSTAELIELGLHVRDAIAGRALFFVNGNLDAAIALAADGVHLPEGAGTVDAVRARTGDRMLVSRAAHSLEAARRAEREGIDIVQLGAIFETTSKPGVPPLGIDALRETCAAIRCAVVGVGGITADNAARVLDAGAAGVAVIGAIFDAEDPRGAAQRLARAIEDASTRGRPTPLTRRDGGAWRCASR